MALLLYVVFLFLDFCFAVVRHRVIISILVVEPSIESDVKTKDPNGQRGEGQQEDHIKVLKHVVNNGTDETQHKQVFYKMRVLRFSHRSTSRTQYLEIHHSTGSTNATTRGGRRIRG